ncbi:uncharacterized protein N0V89_006992 [Didymosphaeria variabile]|uniref:NAD(P)-binding protein n=1 Tax=Didymosphaeria variabile TaxID=1932322 RepID=A0A9W8XIC9_9PLEO|nr:uncharacterized protein N0V89_006992 [Didymosphaeria variabile]KAJ4351649.1 hypothetical protein N0V89_006992 [Didymosphaeria variabile]
MASTIPDTMKAVVISSPGAPFTLKQVPVPQPTHGEILIKVLACGVCLSDYFVQQGAFGTFPRIPGHEIIGVVIKTSEAIQGIGGLGHLAIQYARRMGFRTVALSTSDSKKDSAMQLGATDYVDTSKQDAAAALQDMGGASLIVVTAPNAQVMSGLVGGLGRLGKLLILAPVGDVPFDTAKLLNIGGSVHVWPAGHVLDSEEAIDFAVRQGVECLVERFPLEKAEDAIKAVTSNVVRFRSVLVMV